MLASVVIPVFNRSRPVAAAVSSVLGQTWPDLECIVVDDGSTDDTARALAAIDDRRFRLIRQERAGVSGARNAGIDAAAGELIALLDSDDYFLPEKLAVQIPFLRDKGLDICQTQEIWIRGGRFVNQGKRHAKPAGRIFAQCLQSCCVSPSCTLFTRRFWEACGPFDTALPACEDYDLWLRGSLAFDIGLVPRSLTVKNGGRADQLSRQIIGLDLYRILALVKLLGRDDVPEFERGLAELALAEKVRIYQRGCALNGKPEEAARIAALAGPFLPAPA